MTTKFVQISNGAVVTEYAVTQPVTSEKPGYAEIDSTDARYVAWQAYQTAKQAFAVAQDAGIAITSTGTPALNGTYDCNGMQQNIIAEQVYIATEGTFTNGTTTLAWPDMSGTYHVFPNTATFTAFGKAVAQYVQALKAAWAVVQGGGAWSPPSNAVTIA